MTGDIGHIGQLILDPDARRFGLIVSVSGGRVYSVRWEDGGFGHQDAEEAEVIDPWKAELRILAYHAAAGIPRHSTLHRIKRLRALYRQGERERSQWEDRMTGGGTLR